MKKSFMFTATFIIGFIPLFGFSQSAKEGEVIFYEDASFSGRSGSHSFASNQSMYEIPSHIGLKINNDAMSSLKVGKGVKLTIFNDKGFGGGQIVFCEGEYATLPCNWNDYMSAFRMEKINAKFNPTVKLFSDYGQGKWQKENLSSITIGEWNTENICNDAISAIELPAGLEMTIYEHNGYKGREYTFTKPGTYVMDEYGMNDAVSSIKIRRTEYVLKSVEFKNRNVINQNENQTLETKSTLQNKTKTVVKDIVKINKSYEHTISLTNETSNTVGTELGVSVTTGAKPLGIGVEIEVSLIQKYEHNWMNSETKEEKIVEVFEKAVEVEVEPNSKTTVNIIATPVIVEYDVITTYSPKSGFGPEFTEQTKVQMKYAQNFDAAVNKGGK
jgi:hypothetical protein